MVSRGTTQQSSAPYNRRIVLDVIRRQGRISRREIVDLVSLSPQTVANITNDLQTIGLIVARALDNFFYMHFGVGLGGTLVVNRSAYRGANGNATEIGHIPAVPGGKPCYCGNAGCLERYLSVQSLAEALGVSEAADRDALIIAALERNTDAALQAWCREAAERLRDAVCVIENMLDPLTIVIGGSAPKLLVERLVALAEPLHHSVRGGVASPGTRILLSEREEDSSILGAAVLPIYDLLSPRFEVLQQDRRAEADVAGLLGQRGTRRAGRL